MRHSFTQTQSTYIQKLYPISRQKVTRIINNTTEWHNICCYDCRWWWWREKCFEWCRQTHTRLCLTVMTMVVENFRCVGTIINFFSLFWLFCLYLVSLSYFFFCWCQKMFLFLFLCFFGRNVIPASHTSIQK